MGPLQSITPGPDRVDTPKLAAAIGPRYTTLVYVLAYGGLRWSEAVALRQRRCDLDRRRLEIVEKATDVSGRLIWSDYAETKNHRARAVTLPGFVIEMLSNRLKGLDPDDLVFTAPRGGPMRYSNFRRTVWNPAVKTARRIPAGLTPHELRHTCASLLIAASADPKAVQAHLGHSSIQVTFDVYGHLFDGHLDAVMNRLEKVHEFHAVSIHRRDDRDARVDSREDD